MAGTTSVVLLLVILPLIYLYLRRRYYTYWARRRVPFIEPNFFYGNAEKIIKGEISYGDQFLDFYQQLKARGLKHGGVYVLFNPVYIPMDPKIVRCILQKDFDHFMNRGMYIDETNDPLSGHLFNLKDTKWKNLRAKLTPTFTSGKMKMMYQTLLECCNGLEKLLSEYSNEEPLDIKETIARFTTDIIGSCAFGLECNSMNDPDTEFRVYGRKIFDVSKSSKIKEVIASLLPKTLLKTLGVSFTDKDVEKFFIKIVRDTITYREKNGIVRNDFLHLLIQLQKSGSVENKDSTNDVLNSRDDKKSHLTLNDIAAQCFVFFIAGYETSSTTSTFALYELSINPEIQERLRDEIISVLEKHDNKATYESITEMTYLEKVVNETLRKYPPLPVLHRVCNKTYTIPGSNVTLEEGIPLHIPVLGLHYDPDYYPNPEIFDPERFSEENKARRPDFTFLPFGEGPRICIGLRFGKLQTKLGLITILRNYQVTLNEKTKTPIEMDKKAFILGVEGGVWLNISKL